MSDTADEANHDVLDEAAHYLAKAPGADGGVGNLSRYLRSYYRHVPAEDLTAYGPDRIAAVAAQHAVLAAGRPQGRALVRVRGADTGPADSPGSAVVGLGPVRAVVDIVTDDMPFLVDSVTMELNRHQADITLLLHPRLVVRRDVTGVLHDVSGSVNGAQAEPGVITESWIHVELASLGDRVPLPDFAAGLRRVLDDVRVAVEDQPKMIAAAASLAVAMAGDGPGAPLPGRTQPQTLTGSDTEAGELLSWLTDRHFIFLGYREYDLVPGDDGEALRAVPGTGLGFLRHDRQGSDSFAALPADIRAKARDPHRLVLAKSTHRSTVYRPSYLDYVAVRRWAGTGRVVGEYRFLGLYTQAAYTESITRIPVLRASWTGARRRRGAPPTATTARRSSRSWRTTRARSCSRSARSS
jgi:glutamate dehydrogenase